MDWDKLDDYMKALSPEQVKAECNKIVKETIKADLKRIQHERAMQGYHEIKATDFD